MPAVAAPRLKPPPDTKVHPCNSIRCAPGLLVCTTGLYNGAPLTVYDGQDDITRARRIVKDPLVGHLGARGAYAALAGVRVALPAGEGARGDLHPYPVARPERDPGRPQLPAIFVDPPRLDGARLRWPYDAGRGIALPRA